MLIGIVGELGTGKTLALTYLGWSNYYYKGREICSNYTLYGIPFTPIRTLEDLKRMIPAETPDLKKLLVQKETVALMDEAWRSLDSRCSMLQVKESEKKQIKNKIVTDILSASRKAFVTVIYTSQTISQVDRRIREVTDFVVYPIMRGNYMCTLNFFVGPNPRASALDKQVRFYVEPIFAMYNTYERVYPLEEGYTSEKVYFPIYKNPAWVKYLKDQGLNNEQIIQKSLRIEKMINPNLDVDKYYKNAKIEI
jgi:hypothetical protein